MGHMPIGMNAVARLCEKTDFCKLNCKWIANKAGRKAKIGAEKPEKKLRQRSSIKNPKPVCLVLEQDTVDFIRSQALQISLKEGVTIEPNELIRQALQKAFPTPKQFDMFGDRKQA